MVDVEKLWKNCLLDTYDTTDESDYSSDSNDDVKTPDQVLQSSISGPSSPEKSELYTKSENLPTATTAAIPLPPPLPTPIHPLQPQQKNQNAVVLSREEALVRLIERTHYPIMQENGQRRYGPPPDWAGPAPARGCEIFIGKIPRDCFEDELVPVFESVGKVYMFRLMMDFSGCNRGYGFCIYTNREDTRKAVQQLDAYEIRKSKPLGVCFSVDNCRLFVGGIPKTKTKEEIFFEMSKVTEGVRDVIVYPSVVDKTRNRGFAFVEYENHKAAAMARRKLIPGRIHLWGHQVAVDWAEPEREVDEDVMSKVRILYVRNLMLHTTEETLRDQFNLAAGFKNAVERVKKMKDYAFIHFTDRTFAASALAVMNGYYLDGSRIEVSWAKPADKTEGLRVSQRVPLQPSVSNLALNQGGLFSLLKKTTMDSINTNQLPLQFQQQQQPQQHLLLNSVMNSVDGRRSSVFPDSDSVNALLDFLPQNSGERIMREALAISRILSEPRGVNLNKLFIPQISANLQFLRREQQPILPQQISDFIHDQKESDGLQRILAEMNARKQMERQRQTFTTLSQNLIDQNFGQNEPSRHTNNLAQVANGFMTRPQMQQPISNVLQSHRSMWPDPMTMQNKPPQQVDEIGLYFNSNRPVPFKAAMPNGNNSGGSNIYENRFNRAPFCQALLDRFNPTPCGENLGSELFMKSDRINYNYGQGNMTIASTQNQNSQPNFDSINHLIFNNSNNNQFTLAPRVAEQQEINSYVFSNIQTQLSLAEKLRRRQATIQQLPKDFYDPMGSQVPTPENPLLDQTTPPSLFPQLANPFEFANDQEFHSISPGIRETLSHSPIEAPDLKFSVDQLIMDDEQKLPFSTNATAAGALI